jgi:outer membrane protein assembly factor BamB
MSGKVYVQSDDENLYCLLLGSGKLHWKAFTGNRDGSSSPAVDAGSAYIGGSRGAVDCFSAG